MKLIVLFFASGFTLWLVGACKQTTPEVSPSAFDSVGVVSTFVSAKALKIGDRNANIVALAVDATGNLYAADAANSLIRKITPLGQVSTFAGSGEQGYRNGTAIIAQFSGLASLAFDKLGNLYAGEGFENTCIRKITPTGVVSTFAGQPFLTRNLTFDPNASADGADTSALFVSVAALAFDPLNNLFVSDIGSINRYASNAIREVTPNGYVRTIAGYASGVAYQGQLIDNTPTPFRFLSLVVNKANNLIGVDYLNQLVYQITPTGGISLLLPNRVLTAPHSLAYDRSDNLLVANGQKVLRVGPNQIVTVLTGSDQSGFRNDSLHLARFNYITAMAVDQTNTLYLADQGNGCIRRVRLK